MAAHWSATFGKMCCRFRRIYTANLDFTHATYILRFKQLLNRSLYKLVSYWSATFRKICCRSLCLHKVNSDIQVQKREKRFLYDMAARPKPFFDGLWLISCKQQIAPYLLRLVVCDAVNTGVVFSWSWCFFAAKVANANSPALHPRRWSTIRRRRRPTTKL